MKRDFVGTLVSLHAIHPGQVVVWLDTPIVRSPWQSYVSPEAGDFDVFVVDPDRVERPVGSRQNEFKIERY